MFKIDPELKKYFQSLPNNKMGFLGVHDDVWLCSEEVHYRTDNTEDGKNTLLYVIYAESPMAFNRYCPHSHSFNLTSSLKLKEGDLIRFDARVGHELLKLNNNPINAGFLIWDVPISKPTDSFYKEIGERIYELQRMSKDGSMLEDL